ncbi:Glucan endo-1,3-alpha-glucosidase agn1 [Kalmusia sp. IMI 367209]|nr:Glucan endo-1,3-alpha-glucosidase agn1 [Kalmusia sp. IMI 367209]
MNILSFAAPVEASIDPFTDIWTISNTTNITTTNATSPDGWPIPSNPYPTSLANWTDVGNTTLSDEERNPYAPHSDEIPIVNQTTHDPFTFAYNLTGLDLNETVSTNKKRQTGKPLLRIMPLGASITQGLNVVEHPDSSTDIGYRLALREWLRFRGYEVNYIGSKGNGDFADNENEGHPGYQIAAVQEAMDPVLNTQKPNLVLINAGTNDCTQADDPSLVPYTGISWVQGIPDRLKTMCDLIYKESPGVTIILSTLLPNFNAGNAPSYVEVANQGIRQLYTQYEAQGAKMILAEMNAGWWQYPTDFSDTTHPTDAGYRKMASIWAGAFEEVETAGYLIDPIDTGLGGGDSDGNCIPSSSSFTGPYDTVSSDTGYNDGSYNHASTLTITQNSDLIDIPNFNKSMLPYHQIHFAQLVAFDDTDYPRDELILILDPADRAYVLGGKMSYLQYKYNYGDGEFDTSWTPIDIVGQGTPECLSRGVRFGDINGDGLDDFICINQEGTPFVSLNRGGSPPTFEYIGQIYNDRFAQQYVRLTDIDGDGRLDYCGIDPNGDVYCHRNGGSGDAPIAKYGGYWQGILLSQAGPTLDSITPDWPGVQFLDINGDGRGDYVFVGEDGKTDIYINQRGDLSDGPGLKPHWVHAATSHAGFSGDTSMTRDNIIFGRIYGTGRQDYIRIYEQAAAVFGHNYYGYKLSVWRNDGSGGTRVNGDGIRFCDLTGDGFEDMIYIWDGGMVDVWLGSGDDNAPTWTSIGRMVELATNRKFVHFADWDGDGICDILVVDRPTGDVTVYPVYVGEGGNPKVSLPKSVVSGSLCPQGFSPGLTDLAVRFGDLDGDKRADYLCMDPNGRTVGWLNKASGLSALNQIKVSVGFDRPNHRWADVTGDGLVDFIWVDKHTGNVEFWENNGFIPSIGSSMNWIGYPQSWISGKERGQNIHFPKLRKGSSRADYHIVKPRNGRGITYHNSCGDQGVGPGPDDGAGAVDPNLPDNPYAPGPPSLICPRGTVCGQWPDYPHWVAFGDSYAAGIGAGKHITRNNLYNSIFDPDVKCFQGASANSRVLFYQLQTEFSQLKTFDFIACTGDTCQDVTTENSHGRGGSQIALLNSHVDNTDYAVMTLSIGGNDCKFSDIAIWCLLAPEILDNIPKIDPAEKCAEIMQFAEQSVASGEYAGQTSSSLYQALWLKLINTYSAVLALPDSKETWLFVYGYARFFNAEDQSGTPDQDCAKKSLSISNRLGPQLTVELRTRINNAIDAMNSMIQKAIAQVKTDFPSAKIRYIDVDQFVENHRWCDKDGSGNLIPFGESYIFSVESDDITSENSVPVIQPRDPDEDGDLFGSVGDFDCTTDPIDWSEDQTWVCVFHIIEDYGDGYDCDDYPILCNSAQKKRKRDSEASQLNETKQLNKRLTFWEYFDMYNVKKSFHLKSIVHTSAANYIASHYNTWQLENDGCPCTPA